MKRQPSEWERITTRRKIEKKINLQNHLIQFNKINSYNYKQPNNKKWADTSPEKKNR